MSYNRRHGDLIDRSDADLEHHPDIKPLFPDSAADAVRYYKKTGVYPINHVVVVKDALLSEHPWLADELMRMFSASKQQADDVVPYGVAANRPAIELLMRYAAEQGLIPRSYGAEELFVT